MKRQNREALNQKAQDFKLRGKEADKRIKAVLDKAQRDSEKK